MDKLLKDFSDWSGVNIITQTYYSKQHKKVFKLWLTFIIAMFILTFFIVIRNLVSFQYTSKILTVKKIDSIYFPKITICLNLQSNFDTYGTTNVDGTLNYINNHGSYYTDLIKRNSFKNPETFSEELLHRYRMTTGILTSTVNGIYYKSFNADPQKFLIDFTLHDNHYSNTKLINSTKSFPNKFGNCYIHQGKNDYPIERVGKDFGLSLILEAKVSDIKNRYRKGLGIDPIFGVHMKIEHENDTQNIDFNSNFLSMGYEVNVPITIEKETNDKSFSNCRELATDLSDNFFRQTKYSLDTCFTCCLKEKQYDSCGYETPFSPNIAAYRLNTNKCQTKECYQCSKEELFPDTNEKKKAFFNNCKCLLPCESYRHMYSPSVSKLHVGNIGKLFNYNAGDDKEKINIKSNFVFLNFYIKDLMVKTRTEVVDQIFSNLFSDLGNNLSLLLGIGVFNIVEVLFCLIAICYNRKATGTGFGRDDHLT